VVLQYATRRTTGPVPHPLNWLSNLEEMAGGETIWSQSLLNQNEGASHLKT